MDEPSKSEERPNPKAGSDPAKDAGKNPSSAKIDEWPSPKAKSAAAANASGARGNHKKSPVALPRPRSRPPWVSRAYQIAIAVLVLSCAALYIFLVLERGSFEEQLTENRAACDKHSEQGLSAQATELLELGGIALTQATAAALQRDELAEVQRLIELLVKKRYVSSISVADESGTIVAATNKKWEGTNLEGAFPDAARISSIDVRAVDEDFMVISPVVHDEQRVGTVVLLYSRATVLERLPAAGDAADDAADDPAAE